MDVSYLTYKGSGLINEDILLLSPPLFGVFDGATGLIKYRDSFGKTGGFLAAQIAKEVFQMNGDKPLLHAIQKISQRLTEEMIAAGINLRDKGATWTTSASVVHMYENYIEYVQIGDSPIIFIKKDGSLQVHTQSHDGETLYLWKLLVSEGVRNIRSDTRMKKQLLRIRRNSNTTHGVLNGDMKVVKFVVQGRIPLSDIDTILIFSDGMLIPKENPKEADNFLEIVKLFNLNGLEGVKNLVRKIENSDPSCLKYPRFKKHDDLSAIAIVLGHI